MAEVAHRTAASTPTAQKEGRQVEPQTLIDRHAQILAKALQKRGIVVHQSLVKDEIRAWLLAHSKAHETRLPRIYHEIRSSKMTAREAQKHEHMRGVVRSLVQSVYANVSTNPERMLEAGFEAHVEAASMYAAEVVYSDREIEVRSTWIPGAVLGGVRKQLAKLPTLFASATTAIGEGVKFQDDVLYKKVLPVPEACEKYDQVLLVRLTKARRTGDSNAINDEVRRVLTVMSHQSGRESAQSHYKAYLVETADARIINALTYFKNKGEWLLQGVASNVLASITQSNEDESVRNLAMNALARRDVSHRLSKYTQPGENEKAA